MRMNNSARREPAIRAGTRPYISHFPLMQPSLALEVLLVVLLLGLIVVLVMPSFSHYLARSKNMEAIGLMRAVRDDAAMRYAIHGRLPGAQTAEALAQRGLETEGKYTQQVYTSADGVIVAELGELPTGQNALSMRIATPPGDAWVMAGQCANSTPPEGLLAPAQSMTTQPVFSLPFICR